jgi:type IX secretion system PorP/SprF family membrane protein
MKKIILFVIAIIGCSQLSFGQSVPLFTQYNLNPFVINPAAAGIDKGHQINFNYRSQWTNFPTSPITTVLSYQGQFNRNGLGVILFSDKTGALKYQGISGTYNYQIPISEKYRLSIGMAAQFLRYQINVGETSLKNVDLTDEVVQEALGGVNQLDFNFGAFLQGENGLYAGVSAPHLLNTKLGGSNTFNDLSYLSKHFFGLVGYRTKGKSINFEPSVLVRKVANTPFQVEINNKFWFLEDQLMAGVSYRTAEQTVALMFGFDIDRKYGFYYSYDASFNEISNYHIGSNELTLRVRFGN